MESQFIAWLRQRLCGHRRLRLGPGDDAAVLRLAQGSDCVVTTDLVTDGIDFIAAQTEARGKRESRLGVIQCFGFKFELLFCSSAADR